jgi:hypothetical protein
VTDELLAARQTTHGDFADTAAVAQAIKAAFGDRAVRLPPVQREALDQIAAKLARIPLRRSSPRRPLALSLPATLGWRVRLLAGRSA